MQIMRCKGVISKLKYLGFRVEMCVLILFFWDGCVVRMKDETSIVCRRKGKLFIFTMEVKDEQL